MILPITPKYTERHLGNAQRCVNFYLEKGDAGNQLVSVPGFSATYVGNGAASSLSQVYVASTGQVFAILNGELFEYNSVSRTSRGTVGLGASSFRMADNGTTLFVVGNSAGARVCPLASGSLTTIGDANFPSSPIGAAFLDGYLITANAGGTFYLSQLYDAQDWTPQQFATAESSPDQLVDIVVINRNLLVISKKTIETWYNTGNESFPLERISGQTYQLGTVNADSICAGNGGVYFIGGIDGEGPDVYFLSLGGPQKISTPEISKRIGVFRTFYGSFYQRDGESVYEISYGSGPVLTGVTYSYYANGGYWAEKTSYVSGSYIESRIQKYAAYVNSGLEYTFCFSRSEDKMYIASQTDYGEAASTPFELIYDFDPIGINGNMVIHKSFTLDVDVICASGSDLTVDPTLSWTDNGGESWSTGITFSKDATSTAAQTIRFKATRLGMSRQRIYRIRFAGPTAKIVVKNAEVDLSTGGG